MSHVITATSLGAAERGQAAAAAVAVACAGGADRDLSVLLVDLRNDPAKPRPGLLATPAARGLEARCRELPGIIAGARGRVCFAAAGGEAPEALETALDATAQADAAILLVEPSQLQHALASRRLPGAPSVLVRADLDSDRALVGVLVDELHAGGSRVKVWTRRPGRVAARRALAGLDPGGWVTGRAGRARQGLLGEAGQAVPLLLGVALLVVALALTLVAVGSGATAKGRLQQAADLASLSAARSMRDDFDRLFVPARRADGSVNPVHLSQGQYLDRAREAGGQAAELNGAPPGGTAVRFPDEQSFAPLRVNVTIKADLETPGPGPAVGSTRVDAEAVVSPPSAAIAPGSGGCPATASGGGYGGPLACRQGTPMRPDVAAAFDRMSAAATAAGLTLLVNSGFRSDAEQAVLFAANPDPQMVALPGHSLHRCGTELDLGPEGAYGWLAANADRFGFLQRYSWEAWHFGYTAGPEPCTAAGESGGLEPPADSDRRDGDGRSMGSAGLPAFVPAPYREPLEVAAGRHGISAALLAAQLMAESNFNPNAVSPAGAQGIAQFMPGTAAAYGLDDPFDAVAAIDAQARLMADLLGQFGGSVELALAAYNAGPAPVLACSCVPSYPETQAYVARIIGMLNGAGALYAPAPTLEVRLVE